MSGRDAAGEMLQNARLQLVQQFTEMTGASAAQATFFLDSAKGDIERAIDAFFESGGEVAAAAPGGQGGADDEDDEDGDEELPDLDDDFPEPIADAAAAAGPGGGAPVSLDDATKSMFEKAKQAGARDDPPSPTRQQATFVGKGFSLGKESDDHEEVADKEEKGEARPKSKTYKVTIWKGNAFQLDDAEVRYPTDPINARFMQDLARGLIPIELREIDDNGAMFRVNISLMDKREEDPSGAVVVKPKWQAFMGGGQSLGTNYLTEASSAAVGAALGARAGAVAGGFASGGAAAPAGGGAADLERLKPDPSKPVTVVQLRLPDGARGVANLNTTASVGDLRAFLIAAGHVPTGAAFALNAGFPPKPLSDEKATLEAAGLCNACVTVRLL